MLEDDFMLVGNFVIVSVYFVTFINVVFDMSYFFLLCEFVHSIFVGTLLCFCAVVRLEPK